jgi:hypothetical protein
MTLIAILGLFVLVLFLSLFFISKEKSQIKYWFLFGLQIFFVYLLYKICLRVFIEEMEAFQSETPINIIFLGLMLFLGLINRGYLFKTIREKR